MAACITSFFLSFANHTFSEDSGFLCPNKQKRDIDWARASYYPGKRTYDRAHLLEEAYQRAHNDNGRFPFVYAGIFEPDKYMPTIENLSGKGQLDFVFTSFVRHQLGQDPLMQKKVVDVIRKIVRNGGIYVDIGEELTRPIWKPYDEWKVNVYRIKDGELEFIGTPFVLTSDQADVKRVDPNYFSGRRH